MTGNEFFRTITEEILDYVMRAKFAPEGGFYSTQDADSEAEEGKFFVRTPDEIREVLGDAADAFIAAYGVTRQGNASSGSAHGFEGKNILEFVGNMDQRPALAEARRKPFQPRDKRVDPNPDDVQLARLRQLPGNAAGATGIAAVPLRQVRRLVGGQAAAYICHAFSCRAPVTEPEAPSVLLGKH